jgi:uncharacterized membrane protein YvbJ
MVNYLCSDCNTPVKFNQKKCKNCWAELQWDTLSQSIEPSSDEQIEQNKKDKQKNRNTPWCAIWCGSLILIAVIIWLLTYNSSSTTNNAWTDYISICVYSQEKVKTLLKSPRSAEFPWCDANSLSTDNNWNYTYHSYVDAQNSFWAMLRNDYTCEVSNINQSLGTYNIYCTLQ